MSNLKDLTSQYSPSQSYSLIDSLSQQNTDNNQMEAVFWTYRDFEQTSDNLYLQVQIINEYEIM